LPAEGDETYEKSIEVIRRVSRGRVLFLIVVGYGVVSGSKGIFYDRQDQI